MGPFLGPIFSIHFEINKIVDGYGNNMPPPKIPTWKHGEEVWSSEFRDLIREGGPNLVHGSSSFKKFTK